MMDASLTVPYAVIVDLSKRAEPVDATKSQRLLVHSNGLTGAAVRGSTRLTKLLSKTVLTDFWTTEKPSNHPLIPLIPTIPAHRLFHLNTTHQVWTQLYRRARSGRLSILRHRGRWGVWLHGRGDGCMHHHHVRIHSGGRAEHPHPSPYDLGDFICRPFERIILLMPDSSTPRAPYWISLYLSLDDVQGSFGRT